MGCMIRHGGLLAAEAILTTMAVLVIWVRFSSFSTSSTDALCIFLRKTSSMPKERSTKMPLTASWAICAITSVFCL